MKVKMQTNLILKLNFFLFLFFLFCGSVVNGQFTKTYNGGNQEYDYESYYPSSDLTFYLFGDGHYGFFGDPSHQYNIADIGKTPKVYHTTPYDTDPPSSHTFSDVAHGIPNNNLDVKVLDNKVDLITSWNLVNEEVNYYILRFENNQNTTLSGCVEFHFNSSDINFVPNDILDQYPTQWVGVRQYLISDYLNEGFTHKYKWDYTNLMPGEQRFIYLPANCLALSNEQVTTRAVMKVGECIHTIPSSKDSEGNGGNNNYAPLYTLTSMVSTFPQDPNYLSSDLLSLSEHDINQTVRYRIQFQNSGDELANHVSIDLNINAVPQSLELVNASHDCQLTISPYYPNSFDIDFYNMNLPGEAMTPAPITFENTIGWVEIDVCFDLSELTLNNQFCIEANAVINFDHVSNIRTNIDELCREDPFANDIYASCEDNLQLIQTFISPETAHRVFSNSKNDKNLRLYPNPAKNIIKLDANIEEIESLFLLNFKGQELLEYDKNIISNSIDITNLKSGVYFFRIRSNEKTDILRFVKI